MRRWWRALELRMLHRRANRLVRLLASSRSITRGVVLALLVEGAHDAEAGTVGRATRFADRGDAHAGGKSACLGRRVLPSDWGVAVRGGRCGQLYRVTNLRTGLSVVAPKLDSGPYGAMHEGAWVLKRRRTDPGVWRGVVDLTPPVFAALEARSFDRVDLEVVHDR